MFISVANKHAPIRNKRVRNKKSPWLSAELKKSMINRDKLKKQAVSSNDPLFWKKFKKERNRLNNEIKKAKADYYKSQVESNIGNPKAIWKCINQITHRKATNNSSINELKVNNKSVTEPSDISDILNRHFISIGPNLASALPIGDTDFESYITPARSVFRLKHTTADVVFKILEKLSSHKATGLDNISCRLLKEAAPIISVSLVMIINGSIDSGVFPSKWKIAKIFPLFKANDRTDPHNYRPISVLSTVSKVSERVVYDQLYAYLTENTLLSSSLVFAPSIPQLQLCLDVINEWYLNIDRGMTNSVVFLDLAKAFDTVSHAILLRKLGFYSVKGTTLDWFQSYLSNRQQHCVVEGSISKSQRVVCGVPQGSILGPLLFLLYINDLPECLQFTKPHMYADDTKLSAAAEWTIEVQSRINQDLFNAGNWLVANKLSRNVAKTEHMFFGSNFRLSNLGKTVPIFLGDKQIKRVKHTKYLGVHLDENLKWEEHIDNICSKINRSINGLRQARGYVDLDVLKTIYNALIQPVFDYCDAVWGNLNKGLASKIQKLQNRAARVITFQGYDTRSHYSQKSSAIFERSFPLSCESNPYKSRLRENTLKIEMTHIPRTESFKGSFSYRGAKLWNSLPLSVKSAKSKAIFKKPLTDCQAAA